MFFRPLYIMAVRSLTYIKNSFALDIVKGNVAEQVGVSTYVPITLLFTIRKFKKKIFNFVWCLIFHIVSLIFGLFDDLG